MDGACEACPCELPQVYRCCLLLGLAVVLLADTNFTGEARISQIFTLGPNCFQGYVGENPSCLQRS